MKAVKVMSRDGTKHTYRFKMSVEEFQALDDKYEGLCLGCGTEQGGCEPDAEKYHCEACGSNRVYGSQTLLMVGRIDIIGDGA